MGLREELQKLAAEKPELRKHLVPLLRTAGGAMSYIDGSIVYLGFAPRKELTLHEIENQRRVLRTAGTRMVKALHKAAVIKDGSVDDNDFSVRVVPYKNGLGVVMEMWLNGVADKTAVMHTLERWGFNVQPRLWFKK